MENIKRGDIFYIYKVGETSGSVQQAGRPAVVVSNNAANASSNVIEMVFLTTQPKKSLPTHVCIRSTKRVSTALCEQISSISLERVGEYVCSCTEQEMQMIDIALLISLGIDVKDQTDVITDVQAPVEANEYVQDKAMKMIVEGLRQLNKDILEDRI